MMHFYRLNGRHSGYVILGYHNSLSDPVKVFEKKLHHPCGRRSLSKTRFKKIWAIAISFSGQKRFLPLCGYSPSPKAMESCEPNLSIRDQIGTCFKSAPLVLSVQWELNRSKTPQKTQFKRLENRGKETLKPVMTFRCSGVLRQKLKDSPS